MRPEASSPFREPPRSVPPPRGGVLGWRGPPLGFVTVSCQDPRPVASRQGIGKGRRENRAGSGRGAGPGAGPGVC